ncbi:FecCD family ABC transporter permease [Halarsenatibacter silvermanii]|uniref:Iron complex transport system permease protein n=1 Tax=Halarsenatibacter silvermanii TaxID=321763 RepID=A0A1G9QC79_9FIRM|nr:iron chelate uptake ABC transporter family permease subunit [Halarsenatibacter silvermanii]SDM08674.1 iron complex transport system permease protein [Halarsenatibacter silvermanii]
MLEEMTYKSRFLLIMAAAFVVGLAVFLLALAVGSTSIPFRKVIKALISPENVSERYIVIVRNIRLPRIILSFLVGAGLGTAGVIFQGVIRNPMVDPYIVGISAGAGTAVTFAIVFNLSFTFLYFSTIPFFAFLGALLTVGVVYGLAVENGRVPVMTFLLAGVAVAFILDALRSLVMVMGTQDIQQVVFWLMGSLAGSSWSDISMIFPYYLLGLVPLVLYINDLNLILLGEENAHHMGVDVERVKKILIAGATLVTAAVVSVSGGIGFIGLVIPHISRMLTGPDHRRLLLLAAAGGGLFLVISDMLARSLMPPMEIPVGIITALAGGPYFIYLLRRRRQGRW